jgi:hypothetical protein
VELNLHWFWNPKFHLLDVLARDESQVPGEVTALLAALQLGSSKPRNIGPALSALSWLYIFTRNQSLWSLMDREFAKKLTAVTAHQRNSSLERIPHQLGLWASEQYLAPKFLDSLIATRISGIHRD